MANLSLPAAAEVWGVSRRTAYRLAAAGLIRVARFGPRRVTVPIEEVERVRLEGVSGPLAASPPPALPLPRRGRSKARSAR